MRVRRLLVPVVVGALAGLAVPSASANPEGVRDSGFGDSGLAPYIFLGQIVGVAVQSDGKPVVAAEVAGGSSFGVARFTRDGDLDPSFNGGGVNITTVETDDRSTALALQPDGKVLVAGTFSNGSNKDIAILRYTDEGALDGGFGEGGVFTTGIGSADDVPNAITVQPDGKIVVVGYSTSAHKDFAVLRLTAGGALDQSFGGGDGFVTTPLGSADAIAYAVALEDDGKIIVGGGGRNPGQRFAIRRYTTGGALDTAFGTGGLLMPSLGDFDTARSLLIQPDGMLLAVGQTRFDSVFDVGMIRFDLEANQLDDSFGVNGLVRQHIGLVDSWSDDIVAAALQPDGKVVVTGDTAADETTSHIVVARFDTFGNLDNSFGSGGVWTEGNVGGGGTLEGANAVAVGFDGGIVVGGRASTIQGDKTAVLRYVGDASKPYGARLLGVPEYSLAKQATFSWLASDAGSGVASFDVQRRTAAHDDSSFGAFSTVLSATPDPFGTLSGTPGTTACFRVRGRDFAGNVGAYSPSACEAIPLDERSMSATGTWSKLSAKAYYLGTAMRSNVLNSAMSVHVVYRHLAVVATRCPGCGTIKVFRGSTLLKTINLASGSTVNRSVIEVAGSPTPVSGSITLKQASGGKNVVVDGLAVSLA